MTAGATTDGRTSRPAFEIQTGWLILTAGFDGDDPSWIQVDDNARPF